MVVAATTAVHPDSDGTRGGGVVAGGEPSTTDTSTTTWAWQWSSILLHHIVLTLHARCANRYYYLAAVAAVMKYMEHVQQVTYAAHSLHIILTSSDNTLALVHLENTLELLDPLANTPETTTNQPSPGLSHRDSFKHGAE
ncbi:hypothetical protein Pcinc_037580 [Petrolisthes cinctipes]|uniref:Uncharacterized protein n=1 Tax=Petrolisthes cinctipes TaxID=88211 RepID=A0AAE1BSK3_PETCI|nr:hypothetical protein Pcinc_037580 [Petrolisthes cinctipes]